MTEHRPIEAAPTPVKLRVEDYLLLDEAGAFREYGATELIDGEVLLMSPQHVPHLHTKMELYDALRDALRAAGSSLRAFTEGSVAMPPHSAPQPDIVVATTLEGEGLVPLSSIVLVVEVADATLRNDLTRKATIYAQAGVPEYWVADVRGRAIHQLWAPTAGAYTQQREIPSGILLASATLPGIEVATGGL